MGPAPVTGLVKSLQGRWSRSVKISFLPASTWKLPSSCAGFIKYMLLETRELKSGSLSSATHAVRLILGIYKGTDLVKF
jgi:hypothetical protein